MASDRQAADIVLLDVRGVCSFADFFLICSAVTRRQIDSICEEIDKSVGDLGVPIHHREGTGETGWVLLDFGDLIVHVFAPEERSYYQLEELWSTAIPMVRIQ